MATNKTGDIVNVLTNATKLLQKLRHVVATLHSVLRPRYVANHFAQTKFWQMKALL